MWWRGARVPLFLWGALFVVLMWIKLSIVLGDYEYQMIGQRLLSLIWSYLGFSEMKAVNVTLRDGTIFRTYMGYVPYIPDVQLAWGKMTNAIIGCLILSIVGAGGFAWWYVPWAQQRGENILADHHERGVELVEEADLRQMLGAHNARRLQERAREEYPALSFEEVSSLPYDDRKRAGLLPPYTLATMPFPYGFEQSHVMLVGTTGTGKTTVLRNLVSQAIERKDRCVIFDLTGHYVEAFYHPERDYILNLNDKRCETWSVFNDCETQSEFVSAATALIPASHGSEGGFWERAARTLFVEMCVKLKSIGMTTNKALSDELLKASLKQIHARLKGTVADPLTSPDAAKMAQSIRAVLNTHGEALRFLPEGGKPFSIKEWIKRDDGEPSILFITAQYVHLDTSRELLTLWMNIAINTHMTLKHTRTLRTWFIFDELAALHQLPALERGMQTARSFGGAFVLGLHNFAGLRKAYGDDGAQNIISLANTSMMLRVKDRETAQECSDLIGYRKVRTMDEAYSYGAHQTRDASTISPTTKEEALVIADDITSLPNLTGYIRFPEKFPSTLLSIPYVKFASIAEGFVEADPPAMLPPDQEDDEPSDTGEGGGPEFNDRKSMATRGAANDDYDAADPAANSDSTDRHDELQQADLLQPTPSKDPAGEEAERFFEDELGTSSGAKTGGTSATPSNSNSAHTHRDREADQEAPQGVDESSSGKLARREAQMDFTDIDQDRDDDSEMGM